MGRRVYRRVYQVYRRVYQQGAFGRIALHQCALLAFSGAEMTMGPTP